MKRIVIIGAGPAGITAGYELKKRSKDFEVIILEKSHAIGGISQTVKYAGNRMDLGGHRFFSKDERVNNWWQNVMPMQGAPAYDYKKLGRIVALSPDGPNPENEDRVMLRRNRVSRIYYKGKFFDYPVKMNFSTIKNMGIVTTFVAGCSYLKSCAFHLKEDSLENFYINRFGKKLYSMFFEGYTEKLWGRPPKEISADWGAQRVKGLSIFAILKDIFNKMLPSTSQKHTVETSLIEEFSYPKLGPGELWEIAASDFEKMGGQLIFGANVISLKNEENNISSVTYMDDHGKTHQLEADIVVSSMPLKDLIADMQHVPADISEIANGLPYRDFVTVGLLVKKLNLENTTTIKTLNQIVPDNWIYVQDTSVKLGRIQIFNNWSPYMVADPENTIWMGLEYFCTEGDSFWNQSSEQLKNQGVNELLKMGILASADDVIDYHCEKVQKAYPAYFDTYEHINDLISYISKYDNLYCIGRNGQHRYNNMDHSMETAFQAVDNILNGKTDKTNIWNVNTDQEYHEEKNNE